MNNDVTIEQLAASLIRLRDLFIRDFIIAQHDIQHHVETNSPIDKSDLQPTEIRACVGAFLGVHVSAFMQGKAYCNDKDGQWYTTTLFQLLRPTDTRNYD